MKKIVNYIECSSTNTFYLIDRAYLTVVGSYEVMIWTEREDGTHFVHLPVQIFKELDGMISDKIMENSW